MSHVLDAPMDELTTLARRVANGDIDTEEGERLRADVCTQYGPGAVRLLDQYYDAELRSALKNKPHKIA